MVELRDVIARVMRGYGFRLEKREPKEYLFFEKDGINIIVGIFKKDVTADDVLKFYRDLEMYAGAKNMICTKNISEDAKRQAQKLNISITDLDDLARDLGFFLLNLIEENNEEMIRELLDMDIEVENEEEEKMEETVPIFLEDSRVGEKRVVMPVLTKEDAVLRARRTVQGFNTKLILVPFFIFEYRLEVMVEGVITPRKYMGRVGINGVNGEIRFITVGLTIVSEISMEHEREVATMNREEAEDILKKFLLYSFSREGEEVKIEKENVTIIERRRRKVKEDSLSLKFIGIYYWPYWEVSGSRGKAIVDAVEGNIVQSAISG
ncbi:MAG: hypothetical protein ACPLVI_00370 [Thermoplasmata archaeon]|jgi:hypothetical protein|nr:hypothetical protein [Thermoplasmatales archaeon]